MIDSLDRRDFMQRAIAVLPLLHCGGLQAMHASAATDDVPSSKLPSIGRFARLQLKTHTLEEMVRFYRDTIGLPCEHSKSGTLVVTAGQTKLGFDPAAEGEEPYYHFAFNIPHNKLDAAVKWMEPRCPLIKRKTGEVIFHFPHWDAHAIYFLDPAGNIVEFIARHTLKNDVSGGFGVSDILCASEIGVVTPDVPAAADQLCGTIALERYRGGSEEFTAVGDEQGLFIVVKTGRIWLASDRAAEVFEAGAEVRREKPGSELRLPDSKFQVTKVE